VNINSCGLQLLVLCLGGTSLAATITLDITFDLQAFDPVGSTTTTASGAVAWNGATSNPGAFNQFFGLTSSTRSFEGVSATITGITGHWPGDSSPLVVADPLRSDYFIVPTGTTATLTLAGLMANSSYEITFSHGNNQPGQVRGLDILNQGITGMDIDNQAASGYDVSFTFTANASGVISVGLMGLGGQEGDLAGFRIEGFAPIPESSTVALLSLGGALLVTRRRVYRRRA